MFVQIDSEIDHCSMQGAHLDLSILRPKWPLPLGPLPSMASLQEVHRQPQVGHLRSLLVKCAAFQNPVQHTKAELLEIQFKHVNF